MNKVVRLIPQVLLSLWAVCLIAGCGGGGMSAIGITPGTPQLLDSGQTLTITASVINDVAGQGASYSVTGGGTLSTPAVTRLSSTTYVSVVYTAPTVSASTAVTVTATSIRTPSQTATVSITVNPAIVISTATLANGTVAVPYTAAITAAGGTAPLTFSVTSGTFPPGLKLSSSGAITGTPTTFGTYTFTVGVADGSSVPSTASQTYTVTIIPQPPTITTATLPNGVAGTAYSQQLAYTGGNGTTPAFNILTGTLPPGLTMSGTGLISGTPTNAGAGNTYTFTVSVTIGTQTSSAVSLAITIPPLPVVTTTTLPSGNVGSAYSKQLNYNGGAGGTVSWAITAGSLPASSGLTLSTAGLIAGTPTAAATYSFSVAVTVGSQTSVPQALTLTINSLIITSASTATGEVGLPFSFQLTAAGGKPPYTWSVAAGSLPAGLTLSTAGVISGTPTTSNGSPFGGIVVQATDTVAGTATQTMSIAIAPARSNANNGELAGQYAFLVSGFDASGKPLAAAGNFTADGKGNITSGVIDANGTSLTTPESNLTLTASTFSVGPDGRGKVTLISSAGTSTFVLAVNALASGVATGGYLTEFDNTGQTLAGVFAQTTPAAFTTSSITGGYAFGASGFAANSTPTSLTHRAAAGEFQFNGTGGITSAEYVESASVAGGPLNPKSVAISVAGNGRGTLTLVQPNGYGTQNFVLYIVSAGKFFFLSADPASGTAGVNDLLFGQALQQTIPSGSFAASSLNGTSIVRSETLDATLAGAYTSDIKLGIYTFTGAGTVRLNGDENAGGAPTTLAASGSYTIAANGRVAVNFNSGLGGCANCVGGGQTYFYLVGANQGFVMDFTTSAATGYFEPQTATSIANTSFSGTYSAGTLLPLLANGTYVEASVAADGNGNVTGTSDTDTSGTLQPDVALTGKYVAASSGRATFSALGSGNSVLYIVSPTKALLLDLGATTPVVTELIHQ